MRELHTVHRDVEWVVTVAKLTLPFVFGGDNRQCFAMLLGRGEEQMVLMRKRAREGVHALRMYLQVWVCGHFSQRV